MTAVKRLALTAVRILGYQFGMCAVGQVATPGAASLIARCEAVPPADAARGYAAKRSRRRCQSLRPASRKSPRRSNTAGAIGRCRRARTRLTRSKSKVGILLKDPELAKARDQAWKAATVECAASPSASDQRRQSASLGLYTILISAIGDHIHEHDSCRPHLQATRRP